MCSLQVLLQKDSQIKENYYEVFPFLICLPKRFLKSLYQPYKQEEHHDPLFFQVKIHSEKVQIA